MISPVRANTTTGSVSVPDTAARPGKVLVLGAAVLDRLYYVSKLPVQGETAMSDRMEILPGGKGANQALAARRMGAEVRFISAVGQDEAADFVLKPLLETGIDCAGVARIEKAHTAETVIAVDPDGENQVTSCPGAYHRLTPEHIDAWKASFEWADRFLVQNELPRPTVAAALELGLSLGKPIVFNPSPFRKNQPLPPKGIDVLVPNELEAGWLLGVDRYSLIPEVERAQLWRGFGAKHVVVTMGRDGGEWFDEKGQRHVVPGRPVQAIDTVGAGDTFAGILAALLAEGLAVANAVRMAHRGAELSVLSRGAQAGIPSRRQVLETLQ